MTEQRKTIRFEDLGEPVQKLLRSLKGSVSDEDMALLEFVSVKDMAKIFSETSQNVKSEQIWSELRNALIARREKAERKRNELLAKENEINAEQESEEARFQQEEETRLAQEEAERKRRKEERKRRKAEEAERAEQEEADRVAQEEEQERLRQEEEARDQRRRRKEEKARLLQEEADALRQEAEQQAAEAKKRKKNQRKDWDDYVAQHPLDFTPTTPQEIQQVRVTRDTKPPPSASDELLNRTYTPKCPNCTSKFPKPPPEWDCPQCLRRLRQRVKCWQPDEEADACMVCSTGVGRFSRHHCRNCGRVVCGKCSEFKAMIPGLGFKDTPVKVCSQCTQNVHQSSSDAPTQ